MKVSRDGAITHEIIPGELSTIFLNECGGILLVRVSTTASRKASAEGVFVGELSRRGEDDAGKDERMTTSSINEADMPVMLPAYEYMG